MTLAVFALMKDEFFREIFGNPAKVIRKITEEDKIYWQEEYYKYLEEVEG